MPAAEPIRWPVCSTPPAAPPCRGGTSARVSVWFGAMTSPLPMPATRNGSATAQPTAGPDTSPIDDPGGEQPDDDQHQPGGDQRRPIRVTTRPPSPAATAEPSANGVEASPACSAL